MKQRNIIFLFSVIIIMLFTLIVLQCGGDDDPGTTPQTGILTGTGAGTGTATGSGSNTGTGSGSSTNYISISTLSAGQLVVNEVMYAPSTNSSAEWFEFRNLSATNVDLTGGRIWYVPGSTTSIPSKYLDLSGTIAPNSYFLVTRTAGVPVVGNIDGEFGTISLLNAGGSLILCKDATAITAPTDTNILDIVGWADGDSVASFISSWKEGNICAQGKGSTPANSTLARNVSPADTNDNDTDFVGVAVGTPGSVNIIPDTTPPIINSILPTDGQIDVPPTIANVVVIFNEAMDPAVGTVDFSAGTSYIGTGVWSSGNTIYTLPITTTLSLSTLYYMTFNNFTDVAGNALDASTTINGTAQFTTAATMDTTSPEILMSTPADAATGVSINVASISFSFSEGMNTAVGTVTFAGGSGSLGTGVWTGNTVITYPVTGPLSYSTPYTVTLAGFKDIAGNSLNYTSYLADGELNFTTNSGATGNAALLKISEFQFHGDAGSKDEFIEIYNTGTQSVDFSVHPISIQYKACSNTSSGFTQIVVGIATGSIPANGYYLAVGGSYNGPTPGDITYASDTSGNAGTLAIVDGTAALSDPTLAIDKLSYNRNSTSCANPLPEGSAKTFTTNSDFFDRSLERRSIGDPGTGTGMDYAGPSGIYYLTGNGLDSSNNNSDFVLRLNSLESSGSTGPGTTPQNSTSGTEVNGYVDVTAPTIIGISPSDTETGIATNVPNVVVTFSEAMNTSVGTVTISGGSGSLGTGVWSSGNTILTLPVSGPLAGSTLYTLSFANFTDVAGNPLNTVPTINGTSEFTTASGADITPPEAVSSSPTDGTTGVSISIASISITFNEAMNTTAGSALFAGGIGTISAGVWVGNTVTYLITGPLANNTAYTLTFMGLQDLAGNLVSTTSGAVTGGILNFTTELDTTAPQITAATPTDGATGVSLTLANITFTFNEAMNTTLGTPTLSGGSGSLGAASWTGNTVVSYPVTGPLTATTAYSVTLAGYQDVAGNALNYTSYLADGVLNFTTGGVVSTVSITSLNASDLVLNEVMYYPLTTSNEWIELYNKTSNVVDLSGGTIWYASKTSATTSASVPLAGTIQAGGYFLITHVAGQPIVGDMDGSFGNIGGLGNSGGAVILTKSTTAPVNASDTSILDLVGYSSNTLPSTFTSIWVEGTVCAQNDGYATSPRVSLARNSSSTDTNNNDNDFNSSVANGTPKAQN